MVDTVTTTIMGNDNDDWEVAVDSGEFDKRLEQQEKVRAANKELIKSAASSTIDNDDSLSSSTINFMNSNKPIRILKRPTSQSQLTTKTYLSNSSTITLTTNPSTKSLNNDNNTNNSNSPISMNTSSSTTVPAISIIPRNNANDLTNFAQSITKPVFSSTSLSSQTIKPTIKTYEQRELEYRLARLRIMGEEESSAKDDDDDSPTNVSTPVSTDNTTQPTISSSSSTIRATEKMNGLAQQSLQCHSTPGSYAANLYSLNNATPNTGTIHFTPNNNDMNNSTPNLGTGPFSSPNFTQNYRGIYSTPYSHMPPQPLIPRHPLSTTTTTTTTNTLYMTSTGPFSSAPSFLSSSSVSSPYQAASQQNPSMTTNNWYSYQHPQTPYGTQQYGHPQ